MATIDTIIADIWEWLRVQIFGSDILAGIFILFFVYMAYSSMDMPVPQTIGLTLPTLMVLLFMGYMNWFGWIAVIIAGLLFGVTVYKIYGGR